jgi:hypothetical protein
VVGLGAGAVVTAPGPVAAARLSALSGTSRPRPSSVRARAAGSQAVRSRN